jgi:hypothetical protein
LVHAEDALAGERRAWFRFDRSSAFIRNGFKFIEEGAMMTGYSHHQYPKALMTIQPSNFTSGSPRTT